MKRFVLFCLVSLAIFGLIAGTAQATGCYYGTSYSYGHGYNYHAPSYYYYPSYPIYQASYAPDPDSKVKELKYELQIQKLQQDVELGKFKLEFEQFKRQTFVVPTQPVPPQQTPIPQAAPQPQGQPMPPADPAKPDKTSMLGGPQHPVQSCVTCHDQKMAETKGGKIVGFIDGRVSSPEFAIEGAKQVALGKMPLRGKLNDDQRGQVVEILLAPFKSSAQAPQVGQK